LVLQKRAPLKLQMATLQETVTGTVTDAQTGDPLPGVNILVVGTSTGTATDSKGHYSLQVESLQDTLRFSFIGYKQQMVPIDGKTTINIAMKPTVFSGQQMVVVGFGTEKKKNLTTSVATVSSKQISTTENVSVVNTLTGKIPGVRIKQNSSLPGSFNNHIDIRGLGAPLVVIDGVPSTVGDFERLDPSSIENVSVVKDASAAVYGVRAANGVILVTTKSGEAGQLQLSYSGYVGLQKPTGFPEPTNAVGYMTLYNEKKMHSILDRTRPFTQKDIEAYKSGEKKSVDWFNAVIRGVAPQQHHVLSASGGNENTTYYFNLAYTGNKSFFKSGDYHYHRFNLNSNITTHITDRLSANLKLRGILGKTNRFDQSPWFIVRSIWMRIPLEPIYANNNPPHFQEPRIGDSGNPVAMMNSNVIGYNNSENKRFNSSLTLDYKIPGVKGLQLKGLFSYDYNQDNAKTYRKEYNTYNYDAATDTYNALLNGSPNRVRRSVTGQPSHDYQASLRYKHSILGVHNISAMILYEDSKESSDNFYAQRDIALQVAQLSAGLSKNQIGNKDPGLVFTNVDKGIVGRYTYNYKSTYFAEFDFRYDGSSKFAPGRQWGFFPSGSAGWNMANEPFWKKSALSFIDKFKIRGSYGIVGDDAASSYQFLTGYTYPAPSPYRSVVGGYVFNGDFVNSVESRGIPNRELTWFTSKTVDIGLDADAWNGLLGITADIFRRDRSGLLATRVAQLPFVVGANLPQENLNSDRNEGFEVKLTHKNRVGDFAYNVEGQFAFTRHMDRRQVQAKAGNSYLNWRNNFNNRYTNFFFGYTGSGQFKSFKQIRQHVQSGEIVARGTLPGDFIYKDWNGDGQINDLDMHPIAYLSGFPNVTYGITLGANYKDVGLAMLFKGAAQSAVQYPEQLTIPLWGGDIGNSLQTFLNRWHPTSSTANPYNPNTKWIPGKHAYTGTTPRGGSTFNIHNTAYVRLKSIKISYNIPQEVINILGIQSAQIYFSGYNLLTISPTTEVDPAHPTGSFGYVYPLNKTYNFGFDIKF
jgi:TonB-linked SusC/RagA family outer membrane protein